MTAADLLTKIVYKWKKRKEHRKRQCRMPAVFFIFLFVHKYIVSKMTGGVVKGQVSDTARTGE